ncbi:MULTISPECIES: hypothetical protein [Pseudomonas]|uniref:hypothetical protein n=1 Tax=Pseudomonas TaxID=286 RepID=UPI001C8B7BA1|nr:hypothetical protein [Pseudomonas baetica]MBX9410283.1 hypothetical protein [Pseudomonas baetica]
MALPFIPPQSVGISPIYTDLAVLDVTPHGLQIKAMAPGVTFDYLQSCTEAKLLA